MTDYTAAKEARDRMDVAIREYVQACAEADDEGSVLMTGSVVMWEQVRYDEEGDNVYTVSYCYPTPLSLSSSMGLLTLGVAAIENDTLGEGHGED